MYSFVNMALYHSQTQGHVTTHSKINVCLEHRTSSTTSYLGLHNLLIDGFLEFMTSTNANIVLSNKIALYIYILVFMKLRNFKLKSARAGHEKSFITSEYCKVQAILLSYAD